MDRLQALILECEALKEEYLALQDDFNAPGAMNTGEDVEMLEELSALIAEKEQEIAALECELDDEEEEDDEDGEY
jgi:hypothetical protein|nr:MAG TPA: hypothetical protein [Inoviridae sp.]